MNQCHFLGNLVRDPDIRTTQSGKSVVNVTIAVNRRYKKAGQQVNEAAFLNMEAWDSGADLIAKYFKKGDPIIVHCSVKQDEWTDGEGNKKSALKFRINEFEFVPGNRRSEPDAGDGEEPATASATTAPAKSSKGKKKEEPAKTEADGDIPF